MKLCRAKEGALDEVAKRKRNRGLGKSRGNTELVKLFHVEATIVLFVGVFTVQSTMGLALPILRS